MTAADPNVFVALLLGGIILYPLFGPAILMLASLWLLAKAPVIFFALGGAWLGRKLIFDFALAYIAGRGFGAGTRSRRQLPPRRERVQRYRRPPRNYEPNDSFDDDWPENLPR